MRSTRSSARRALAAFAIASIPAAGARAQPCTNISYAGVPDFDQVRALNCGGGIPGLEGDGGGHCYPTSLMNWMAYLANHGFPELTTPAGPRNWQSATFYNSVTLMIDELGNFMGTGPGGTPSGWPDGFAAYIDAHAPYDGFAISTYAMDAGAAGHDLMRDGAEVMRAGGFLELGIKWMTYNANTNTYTRTGAHLTSLTRIDNPCAVQPSIELSDPGSGGTSSCNQSTFSPKQTTCTFVTANFDEDGTGPNGPVATSRFRLDGYTGSNKAIVWGGLRAFFLPFAVGRCNPIDDPSCLRLIRPRWWDFDPSGPIEDIDLPFNAPILSVALSPQMTSVLFTTQEVPGGFPVPARLLRYSIGKATFQTLASFSQNPGPIAFDRFGELFVLDGRTLRRYDVSGATAVLRATIVPSVVPDSLIYDDVTDELVGVSAAEDRLVRWRRSLTVETSLPLPTSAQLDGVGLVTLSPLDNRAWVMGSNVNSAYEVFPGAAGGLIRGRRAALTGATGATALSMDPRGRLCVAVANLLKVYAEDASGLWPPATGSPFHNQPLSGTFALPRSRDNFNGPGRLFQEFDSGQDLPSPCSADFNADGRLNSQDFFDFLAAFFAGSPAADFNNSNTVNSQDFFDFVAAFFRGCP